MKKKNRRESIDGWPPFAAHLADLVVVIHCRCRFGHTELSSGWKVKIFQEGPTSGGKKWGVLGQSEDMVDKKPPGVEIVKSRLEILGFLVIFIVHDCRAVFGYIMVHHGEVS